MSFPTVPGKREPRPVLRVFQGPFPQPQASHGFLRLVLVHTLFSALEERWADLWGFLCTPLVSPQLSPEVWVFPVSLESWPRLLNSESTGLSLGPLLWPGWALCGGRLPGQSQSPCSCLPVTRLLHCLMSGTWKILAPCTLSLFLLNGLFLVKG